MKISYVHGICVKNDAISNSIHDEIIWLDSVGRHSVRLFAYVCDWKNLPYTSVDQLRDVAFDEYFQSSELVVFHFGVFYPLFDLLPVVPFRARRVVVFHNITPREHVAAVHVETIDRSFKQMANIAFADDVVCDSETNVDVLRRAGIQTPSTVLPLAINGIVGAPASKPSHIDGRIRVAFIGRFVRSKGPMELLYALGQLLLRDAHSKVDLDMVGNLQFSEGALVEEIEARAKQLQERFSGRVRVAIHGNATEEMKGRILGDADIFVLPTYHEGFCVPILEALGNGCRVVCYDNSNTPTISGGFATLTPTGDQEALSWALQSVIEEIGSPNWLGSGDGSYAEYSRKTQKYVKQYSPERSKERFLRFVERCAGSSAVGK
jgi:glycosyltransferase involved in cell wall biosynthesis